MSKKKFLFIPLFLFSVLFPQEICVKNTIRKPFAVRILAHWNVVNVNKFKVEIVVFVNKLYDLFAKFTSSTGEDFEIYKFKKRIAIFEKPTGKWIPYRKNFYLTGIRLLSLRKLFLEVLKTIKNREFNNIKCIDLKKQYNFVCEKKEVEGILSFLFEKGEIPATSSSKVSIECSCDEKLQSVLIHFDILDRDVKIKGTMKFNFFEYDKHSIPEVPPGIKKFLGK
ncbi:MAG: hypothetical protein ACK4NF_04380 [Planctomycetota bacterium]